MADLTADLASLNITDRVAAAVKKFEEKQVRSNQQWLEARVQRAEATKPGAVYDEKAVLAKCLGHDDWASCTAALGVATPLEILTGELDVGQGCPGTYPPVTAEQLDMFLERLQLGINKAFDQDDPDFEPVPLPEDYIELLRIADGIHDCDLRKSGVPRIDGVSSSNPERMTRTEGGECPVDGNDYLKIPWGRSMWRDGWDLSTGFHVGEGEPSNRSNICFFYCARDEEVAARLREKPDDIKDSEREWRWRIIYGQKVSNRIEMTAEDKIRVFDGIPEFLEWYGDWWVREKEEMEEYPAWYEGKVRDAKMMYGDGSEDEDEEQTGGWCACGCCPKHGPYTCASQYK